MNPRARLRTATWCGRRVLIALVTVLALVAAACGDDAATTTVDPDTATPIPTTPEDSTGDATTTVPETTTVPATATTRAPEPTMDLSLAPDDGREGVVRIGTTPSYDDRLFAYAESIGIAENLGLSFELIPFVDIPFQQLAVDDIDWLFACQFCYGNVLEEFPNYRTPLITNHYKGFVVIGRAGDLTFEQALADNDGDREAALKDLADFVRGKDIPRQEGGSTAPIQIFLESLGLTLDDVTITRPANRDVLAQGFLAGEFDLYLGTLNRQARMLYSEELAGQYVVVGPLELFGGRALWYSTEGVTQDYLDCCYESVLRTVAAWYRAARYLKEMPEIVGDFVARDAIAATGGESLGDLLTVEILTELNHFYTLEEAGALLYDPSAPTYFGIPGETAFTAYPDLDWSDFELEEQIYNDLIARDDLVAFINRPLGSGVGRNGDNQ